MENGSRLFRKESIDHISSPEQMNDYMRVTSPRLWMILSAVLVLLIGFVIYASTATMESTLKVQAEVFMPEEEATEQIIYYFIEAPVELKDQLQVGMTVRIAGYNTKINSISHDEEYLLAVGTFPDTNLPLQSGKYDAEVVTESTTPISFLLN